MAHAPDEQKLISQGTIIAYSFPIKKDCMNDKPLILRPYLKLLNMSVVQGGDARGGRNVGSA